VTTRLDKQLRREITVRGEAFVVIIDPDGLKLVAKGRRKGLELAWEDLISGEAALATALAASLDRSLPLEPAKHAQGGRPPAGRKARRRAS
jgi:hypothetical protein